MNQKKSKKILIIAIILVIVLILGVGFAYAYIATDIFRSDKEIFFKYITQISNSKNGFINNEVIQYFEKKKNTPYETNGNVNFNIASSTNQEQFENTNKCNITFLGKVDNSNSKLLQDISINYSDDVKFPFEFKKVENTIGVKTAYVGSKFIGVETDNLDNLQNSTYEGASTEILENTKSINDIQISDEQLQYIKDTYFNVLNQELKDDDFSTIMEENQKGYKLTLNGEKLKNLIIKLLETLKNDQITLDKINEYIETQKSLSKITISDIEKEINELNNNSEINDEKIEITVFIDNKSLQKINISLNEASAIIEKIESGNSKQYNISLELYENNETTKLYLNTKYSGLQSLQIINEEYELGIQTSEDTKYVYYLNNEVDFIDTTDISDFNDDNALILTELENEQVTTLMNAISERLIEVNKQQMEKLGLTEDKNPLQYLIPSLGIYSEATNIINQTNMSELEINSFNQKFEMYESSNLKGVTVKGLLSTISLNNESHDDKKINEINFNGQEYETTEENITLIKSEVNTEESYRVEFEREENTGLIYRAVINKK